MRNDISLYTELIDLIEEQGRTINKQNEIIARLVNENLEKENMINALIQEHSHQTP